MNPTSSHGQENKGQTSFFAQKAEKLATAVYMITDIIDSREPLRWKIREEAMEVLSLMSVPTGDVSSRWNVLYRASQAIDRIEHILYLARNAKLLSAMNVSIVLKEYLELKEKITIAWGEGGEYETFKLNHQFFKVEALPAMSVRKSFPQHEIKRTSATESQHIGQTDPEIGQKTKIHQTDTQKDQRDIVPETYQTESVTEKKKTDRRSIILELLKSKSSISVGEALKEFHGVSDKTIQRELVAMVEAGILLKKGEKRWSTYSLKN